MNILEGIDVLKITEIFDTENLPYGDLFYENKIKEEISISVVDYEKQYFIWLEWNKDFLYDCQEELEDMFDWIKIKQEYFKIKNYSVLFIPSTSIFPKKDIYKKVSNYKIYDYENKKWVKNNNEDKFSVEWWIDDTFN